MSSIVHRIRDQEPTLPPGSPTKRQLIEARLREDVSRFQQQWKTRWDEDLDFPLTVEAAFLAQDLARAKQALERHLLRL